MAASHRLIEKLKFIEKTETEGDKDLTSPLKNKLFSNATNKQAAVGAPTILWILVFGS